jgi:hypothetical protein
VLVLAGPVGLVEQELGGGPAELVLGLAHRGERDRGVGSELDVVVVDYGEVRGYRHPGPRGPAPVNPPAFSEPKIERIQQMQLRQTAGLAVPLVMASWIRLPDQGFKRVDEIFHLD